MATQQIGRQERSAHPWPFMSIDPRVSAVAEIALYEKAWAASRTPPDRPTGIIRVTALPTDLKR